MEDEDKQGQHRKCLTLLSTENPTKSHHVLFFFFPLRKFFFTDYLDHNFYLLKTAEKHPSVIQSATVVCPVTA